MTSDDFSNFLACLKIFRDHVTTFVVTGEDLLMILLTLGEDRLMTMNCVDP
jgi:hypothetical protein